ncbi:MAG: PHP domain-containing protein [Gammaproteobacteria bacterium]|nr:PHP domain-containing protein [Gammaproteobacteria bacterium]
MANYDLHTHSTASDGVFTPAQLLRHAHEAGVDVLALTDHDTLDGLQQAREAAAEYAVRLVPGVEISVTWEDTLFHIVGLGVDEHDNALLQGLAALREQRDRRALVMAQQLERIGIPDSLAGAKKYQSTRVLSRTHFAHYLAEIGAAGSIDAAFNQYLKPGTPGYVATRWASLAEAIDWINGAGGVAVVAHPGRYRLGEPVLQRFLGDFVDCGGAAIEVVYPSLAPDNVARFADYAGRYGLFASLGSDFHRPDTSRKLGQVGPLPDGTIPVWRGRGWNHLA